MFKKKKGKNSNQKVKAGHIKNQKPKKKENWKIYFKLRKITDSQ